MSPILTLLLQTIVIVTAARCLGAAFRRLGQPAVVGEMVAGLLLGPSLFGAIAPAASRFLFPPASLDLLNAFSQFGLVLFMLLVGLHLDTGLLRANSRLVLATSYTSMLLPFALGVILAFPLSRQFGIAGAARLPFMLFVGLSLSITAFPVLVRIVDAHHLSATRLGTVAIACAAFDDVTAWIALALVTSHVHGSEASGVASLLWLGVYAAVMLIVGAADSALAAAARQPERRTFDGRADCGARIGGRDRVARHPCALRGVFPRRAGGARRRRQGVLHRADRAADADDLPAAVLCLHGAPDERVPAHLAVAASRKP